MRHGFFLVQPVLAEEIHQGQRASLLQTHGEMESCLFDPLKREHFCVIQTAQAVVLCIQRLE